MKRNYYSVRHIQRVRAMERTEQRLQLQLAARMSVALMVVAANIWAVATYPA